MEVEAKLVSKEVDLVKGLSTPETFTWSKKPLVKFGEALAVVKSAAPVNGVDVVPWMQEGAATKIIILGAMEDYNRLGSKLVGDSDDPYIPGLSLSNNYYFRSERNSEVKDRGHAYVVTPVGTYSVPMNGSRTIAKGSFLGWAAWVPGRYALQWVGTLLWWKSLASRPVDQRVRFVEFHGLVAPQFFRCTPNRVFRNVVRVGLTTDVSQKISFKCRLPADYSRVMYNFTQEVSSGQSEVRYTLYGLMPVTDHVLEIQPSKGSVVVDYVK